MSEYIAIKGEQVAELIAENKRLRVALEEIAECEIGFEGQVARKALNPDKE